MFTWSQACNPWRHAIGGPPPLMKQSEVELLMQREPKLMHPLTATYQSAANWRQLPQEKVMEEVQKMIDGDPEALYHLAWQPIFCGRHPNHCGGVMEFVRRTMYYILVCFVQKPEQWKVREEVLLRRKDGMQAFPLEVAMMLPQELRIRFHMWQMEKAQERSEKTGIPTQVNWWRQDLETSGVHQKIVKSYANGEVIIEWTNWKKDDDAPGLPCKFNYDPKDEMTLNLMAGFWANGIRNSFDDHTWWDLETDTTAFVLAAAPWLAQVKLNTSDCVKAWGINEGVSFFRLEQDEIKRAEKVEKLRMFIHMLKKTSPNAEIVIELSVLTKTVADRVPWLNPLWDNQTFDQGGATYAWAQMDHHVVDEGQSHPMSRGLFLAIVVAVLGVLFSIWMGAPQERP